MITPCVLPLVPGYLSAVSAVEADRLGERGVARRIVVASIPFFIGFTVVFVALGAGAAALGGYVDAERRNEIAGFVLVVLGLAFMGLLPWPERMVAPGVLEGARRSRLERAPRRGVRRLRSALHRHGARVGARARRRLRARSFAARCCSSRTRAGIAAAFVLAGIAFARAMGAFRWLRDHYVVHPRRERGRSSSRSACCSSSTGTGGCA